MSLSLGGSFSHNPSVLVTIHVHTSHVIPLCRNSLLYSAPVFGSLAAATLSSVSLCADPTGRVGESSCSSPLPHRCLTSPAPRSVRGEMAAALSRALKLPGKMRFTCSLLANRQRSEASISQGELLCGASFSLNTLDSFNAFICQTFFCLFFCLCSLIFRTDTSLKRCCIRWILFLSVYVEQHADVCL